jgi:hypothetical protein
VAEGRVEATSHRLDNSYRALNAMTKEQTNMGANANTPRTLRRVLAALAVVAAVAWAAPAAQGAFGDNFGINDVNVAGAPTAPAFPGTSAFWAGTCDITSAPIGPIAGGVGSRPDTVWAPTFEPGNTAGTGESQPVAAPEDPDHCIDFGRVIPDDPSLWSEPPAWRLAPINQAGAHPDGTATMWFRRLPDKGNEPDGSVDNIHADLPAGFVGDTTAVPKCSAEVFALKPALCPPETQVGVIRLFLATTPLAGNNDTGNMEILPVFNLAPRSGNTAELGFTQASVEDAVTVRIVAKPRTNGDFGVSAFAAQIPAALPVLAQSITLWGTPWAASHDEWRPPAGWDGQGPGITSQEANHEIQPNGLPAHLRVSYDPSWGPIRPFLSNPTECSGLELNTRMMTDAFQRPGAFFDGFPDLSDADWKRYDSPAPPITGCSKNPFDPSASFGPTSTVADGPTGFDADITIPPNDMPPTSVASNPDDATGAPAHWTSDAGLATSHLDRTVVRLPEGLSVNPSAAAGLEGCSDAQMGVRQDGNPKLFNNSEPSCPDGSRIGTAEATTPVLDGSPNLTGDVFLGTPRSTDPQSGEMFRMFLVLRNPERGLLAKVYGSSTADPATGRLVATFDKNPRVPVENIKVRLKGGDRGLLANPQTCGERAVGSEFTPWTAAHGGGGPIRDLSDPFTVAGDCSFGFSPALAAGMSTQKSRSHGSFSFRFTRQDGEQWIDGLTATLPKGLLASVKNLPLCGDAQAAAGSCPSSSRIGSVDASAGSGSPFVLERKGDVYLTQGYKGCAYGLVVIVPVEAGPFRGPLALSNVVVRQKVCVDPATAQVSATSDPLPLIHHGVPLRVRSVTVNVDRDKFMLNPSDCQAKQIVGDFHSPQGTNSRQTVGFQTSGCAALPFKPKLKLALTGRKQVRTGKHPGVKATVTQKGVGEAGIEEAVVRLPKSLALDVDNAQALCEFEAGTKPDIERQCPKGAIVGRARASSPLLNRPLAGNVYFVKNVRIDKKTGNQIRTLPMIIVALRGEIAVNLKGESSTTKSGKLVNTFASVPDAPVTRFNLNIKGGKNGILAVTRTRRSNINLCARPKSHVAEADMDGHNGKRHDRNVRMKTPCGKKSKNKAAAKRRLAKRRASANRQG